MAGLDLPSEPRQTAAAKWGTCCCGGGQCAQTPARTAWYSALQLFVSRACFLLTPGFGAWEHSRRNESHCQSVCTRWLCLASNSQLASKEFGRNNYQVACAQVPLMSQASSPDWLCVNCSTTFRAGASGLVPVDAAAPLPVPGTPDKGRLPGKSAAAGAQVFDVCGLSDYNKVHHCIRSVYGANLLIRR